MPRQLSVDFQRFKSLTVLFDDDGPTSINVQYDLRGDGESIPKAQTIAFDELTQTQRDRLTQIFVKLLSIARQRENV